MKIKKNCGDDMWHVGDNSRKVGRKLPHLDYWVDKGKKIKEKLNKRKREKKIRRKEKMKKRKKKKENEKNKWRVGANKREKLGG